MRALPKSVRRWVALGGVVVVAAAAVVLWPGASAPAIATEDLTIPGAQAPWDSEPVSLDTTIYFPAVTPAPAVIVAHGFGGSKRSVADDAQELARAGFVAVAYSARGFGDSTGTISLDSLDAEIPDARAIVDYLATRPEVQLDGPGDPRVGVTGGSYGGALSLMLAGTDRRIDAAVPVITWNSLQQALFPNALVDNTSGPPASPADVATADDGVFKKYWAASLISSVVVGADLSPTEMVDLGPGSGTGGNSDQNQTSTAPSVPTGTPSGTQVPDLTGDPGCGRLRLEVCAAYANAAGTGRIDATMQELLGRSSPAAVVGDITAPTLLVQGELDTLFGLDQADANARAIAANGTTVAVDWYRGGHDGGSPDPDTRARITGWLQYYLSGVGAEPTSAFRYSVDGGLTDRGRARTRVLQADSYPGLVAGSQTPRQTIPLGGPEQVVLNPPGGSPAAISSLPGLGRLAGSLSMFLSAGMPGQSATFASDPFSKLTVVTGSGQVSVTVQALPTVTAPASPADGPVLFASIGSVTAGGLTSIGGNAVAPVRLPPLPTDGSPVTVTINLPAASLQVAEGDRLIVRFATTDQAYSGPTTPAAYRISGVNHVQVPVVGGVRVSDGELPVAQLIGAGVLALLAIVGLAIAGRVRSRERLTPTAAKPGAPAPDTTEPETTDDAPNGVLPLRISNLSKAYPGGVQAVSDVSFVVRPGRVLGLLGPNGAGKTTTLRMVMGLIRPTGGDISVFGKPVSPGAVILSRIGSFVEGSGFLPHLSGRANLDLYWRATGRPAEDSHLEQVMAIAGLGKAVNRRVKTYSQGMRQRLAIAQAMLGLPDLLLLDEPMNGLDPPQIHAMREVLRRYAATGRTVLVSSHLLSEVEQTCHDVVVINGGVTIAAGTVQELIAGSGEMTFTLDDPEAGVSVLLGLDGVVDAEVSDGAVLADLGSMPAATAVHALVTAGIGVTAAAPRNRLEDVFLDLVGATSPGQSSSSQPGGSS